MKVDQNSLQPDLKKLGPLKRQPKRLQRAIAAAEQTGAAIGEPVLVHFWRWRSGFNRAQFGEFLGTDAATVALWETGDLRIVGHPRGILLWLKHVLENGVPLPDMDRSNGR